LCVIIAIGLSCREHAAGFQHSVIGGIERKTRSTSLDGWIDHGFPNGIIPP